MKNVGNELGQILIEILPAICIALFGGFVEMMLRAEKGEVSAKYIISTLVVAGFVGMIVSLILYDRDVSPALHGAAVGVAGASARTIMDLLQRWCVTFLKRNFGG